MKNNILVSAGVALLVVVLGLVFFGRPSVQTVREVIKQVGAIPGNTLSEEICYGGSCEFKRSEVCVDGAEDLVAMRNPWSATSSLEFEVQGLNGTSTIVLIAGTSTQATLSAGTSTVPSPSVISYTWVATSTNFHVIGGLATSSTMINGSNVSSGGKAVIGPNEYFHLFATSTANSMANITADGALGGIRGANNLFTCRYNLNWKKLN